MNSVPEDMVARRRRLWWLAAVNKVGALITTAWTLVLVFNAAGLLRTLLTAVLLCLLLYPGPAALFVVSASVLCFHYGAVGIWLPICSYLTAGTALILDWNLSRTTARASMAAEIERESLPLPSAETMNREEWHRQLSGIVEQLGVDSPELKVRVLPSDALDPKSTPLFEARADDLPGTLSRLRSEFGTGQFQVVVFVSGEVRRRFLLLVDAQ